MDECLELVLHRHSISDSLGKVQKVDKRGKTFSFRLCLNQNEAGNPLKYFCQICFSFTDSNFSFLKYFWGIFYAFIRELTIKR